MNHDIDFIYTISDYYDGIRQGVTTVAGQPFIYQSLWTDLDDKGDTFLLQPIDQEAFQLVLEGWAIWIRWDAAFESGQTSADTHPALPAERQRHDELDAILTQRLTVDPDKAVRAELIYLPIEDRTTRQK